MSRLIPGLILLLVGLVGGVVLNPHLKHVVPDDARRAYLASKGDAPAPVRAEVLTALRMFQDGYSRRDPRRLDAFMHRLFPESDEVLILGTDAGEWVRGYSLRRSVHRV